MAQFLAYCHETRSHEDAMTEQAKKHLSLCEKTLPMMGLALMMRAAFLACTALGLMSSPVLAQSKPWPSSQIRMVIGYSPGGAADIIARIFADAMGKYLGQNIVVDNRPGAGSTLSTALIVNAPADGYTIGLGTATIYGIDQYLFKVKYSSADLTPVTQLTNAPMILAVNKSLGVNSIAEFVAYAKANPGIRWRSCSRRPWVWR
jgi:tripartite-type tricarboxylate transporter receptor subunit TctC